ncbi:VWA domain-containing protein [Flammeovirgaceae bacterium SG7u.111]|nr:VWA domain-containing protein [Flammeovirgaceae bacterium SG7u.132]WPO36269.1 VWA domain-containing protein [Flammeovirgaceae bacterium SG7u.111]
MDRWLETDFSEFHFLRPDWLWAFVPMLVVLLLLFFSQRENEKWLKVIPDHLREFMTKKGSKWAVVLPIFTYVLVVSLAVLGIAGPTWERVEVPGAKTEAMLLIGIDLSNSMLVEDMQPNRLERAKFKIKDLLDAKPRARTGMFAFAGTAHIVIPPCTDSKLILHHLETLSPAMMPILGTNMEQAISLADTILSRTVAPSTLLLITDNIEQEDVFYLEKLVNETPHSIELLAMATPQGGAVPSYGKRIFFKDKAGEKVVSKLDPEVIFQLQNHPKINVNTLTLDNSDMEIIAKKVRDNLTFQEEDEKDEKLWKDVGFYLLIPLLVLILFWFRRGWVVAANLVFCLVLPSCGEVKTWEDLWYSKDYQAQKSYNEGDFEKAAALYQDPFNKGVAYYKAGNYDAAIFAFEQDTSLNSQYNKGLALVAAQRFEEAQQVFEELAEAHPEFDAAKKSLKQTEDRMMEIDSLRSIDPTSTRLPENKKEDQPPLNERTAKGEDEELTSDTQVDELPETGDRVTDEVETGVRKAEELERPPEDFESGAGEKASNVLLRKISDDPSEFLKRKFKYQVEKYKLDSVKTKNRW